MGTNDVAGGHISENCFPTVSVVLLSMPAGCGGYHTPFPTRHGKKNDGHGEQTLFVAVTAPSLSLRRISGEDREVLIRLITAAETVDSLPTTDVSTKV